MIHLKETDVVSRRRWLLTSSTCVLASATIKESSRKAFANEALADEATVAHEGVIDSHVHFYDPDIPGGLVWPGKGSSLYRQVLPKHLLDQKQYAPIRGVIIVEASPIVGHNDWLLELSTGDPLIKGIVGNLTPGGPDFRAHLETYRQKQLFCGIRINATLLGQLLEKQSLDDLRLLSEARLTLDVLGDPNMLPSVVKLAKAIPSLTIVVDHLCNVRITKQAPPKNWVDGIADVARFENVYCKVSGLMENARSEQTAAPTETSFYQPYLDVVWDNFGEDRLMYGSNWPVCEIAGDHEIVQRIAIDYFATKGTTASKKFATTNAMNAYRV